MERLTNCTPSRRSNCRTIWLAADWETLLVCAAWEKLRNRATSQNTFRDSNCMALILSSAFLISRPRYIIISYNVGSDAGRRCLGIAFGRQDGKICENT